MPHVDWRTTLPADRRRHLRAWYLAGAVLTFCILVVGGITRLTESGLSMVDWKPIMGAIPPMDDASWRAAFAQYQQYPEFQKLRPDMTLSEFKFIFFWEYTHRLLARTIGLVFLIPFGFFALRGYFTRPLLLRSLALFGLGGLQGFVGWFMVRSGLVDDPRVSHYRLALHLFMALSVFALCLWLRHELRERPALADDEAAASRGPVHLLGGLLLVQILWGAFVAGLDAGLYFNTFPTMGGRWLPPSGLSLAAIVSNPITVQWVHRLLGTVLLAAAAAIAVRERSRTARLFAGLVGAQYALGIATLIYAVPVALGVLHQALAVVIFGVWIAWLHRVHRAAAPHLRTVPSRRPAAVRLVGPAELG